MGPKRFQSQNFSLLIVKFKKLGFSALLRSACLTVLIGNPTIVLNIDVCLWVMWHT